ncbi:MAG: hypothetical protein WC364_14045 [Eubacteriales bacterium]
MFVQINPEYGVNYKSGQIYCTYRETALSAGISWFEYKDGKTPEFEKVTHVGICISATIGISAQPQGIDFENLTAIFQDPHTRIFFVEPKLLDSLGPWPLIGSMISRVGEKYDYKIFAGFALVNSWLGKFLSAARKEKILQWFDDKNKVVCSQVVAQELLKGGYCKDPNTKKMPRDVVECECIKPWKK